MRMLVLPVCNKIGEISKATGKMRNIPFITGFGPRANAPQQVKESFIYGMPWGWRETAGDLASKMSSALAAQGLTLKCKQSGAENTGAGEKGGQEKGDSSKHRKLGL